MSEFKVIGYFPAWRNKKEPKIRYDVFTHINYSFAFFDSSEELIIPNMNDAEKILRHAYSSTKAKVILGLGGWNDLGKVNKDGFLEVIRNSTNINKIVKEVIDFIDEVEFHGVDLCFCGLSSTECDEKVKQFISLLSMECRKRNKTLSLSTFGYKDEEKVVCLEKSLLDDELKGYFDWINVIDYELREGTRKSNVKIDAEFDSNESVDMPSSSINIGIPMYANISILAYGEDVKNASNELKEDKIVTCGREMYYPANEYFENNVEWAIKNANGLNIWEVTQDYVDRKESFLSKINEKLEILQKK